MQYLEDLKERGARIIIGDFYSDVARRVMCQARRSEMTQAEGYVWLLPGWYKDNWFDIDTLRRKQNNVNNVTRTHRSQDEEDPIILKNMHIGELPDCSTQEMIEALDGHFSMVHERFAADDKYMETNITVGSWKAQLNKELEKINEQYRKRELQKMIGGVDRNKISKMSIHLFR